MTEQIFKKMKKNAYKRLFTIVHNLFPHDKQTSNLSPELLKLINPFFLRIKSGFKYQEETFINECDSLFHVTSLLL